MSKKLVCPMCGTPMKSKHEYDCYHKDDDMMDFMIEQQAKIEQLNKLVEELQKESIHATND